MNVAWKAGSASGSKAEVCGGSSDGGDCGSTAVICRQT